MPVERLRLRLSAALLMAAAALAASAPLAAACPEAAVPSTPPPSAPAAAPGYRLVKDWDFCHRIRTAEQLQAEFHTRYVYKNGTLDFLNDEWQRYRDNRNHQFTPQGLALVARAPGGLARGAIESGMLRSRWSGEYGYFEASLRVPAARGAWPAFWLNPQDARWPPEIDVLEIVNNGRDGPTRSFHFLHDGQNKRADATFSMLGKNKFYQPGFSYAEGFHRFAVLWTPEAVATFVDDLRIQESPFSWTHADGVDAGPAHVLLNLAVGGGWPGAPERIEDFPMQLDVQYIRV